MSPIYASSTMDTDPLDASQPVVTSTTPATATTSAGSGAPSSSSPSSSSTVSSSVSSSSSSSSTSSWDSVDPKDQLAPLQPTIVAASASTIPTTTSNKRPQSLQLPLQPNKRHSHRGRSRSLPNLLYESNKVHKRKDSSLPTDCTIGSRRSRKKLTFNQSQVVAQQKLHIHSHQSISTPNLTTAVGSSIGPISTSTSNTSSISLPTSSSPSPDMSSSSSPAKHNTTTPWVQPPPVNSVSLREIDLQEIFKNPQLRHDIVFDPQLQFRPNLDGERGKRKKMMAEKYWDSIVLDCQDLVSGKSDSSPKLVLLFSTLREILLSLLPVHNRSYVDSVLDPDLLIQQVRHSALDFLGLAKWLSSVFKAHCAPMRDSWVDQMVSRIELGISTKSPKRLVEGLRMVFAILEAMKLDVANHQIRTLRPMLVESAIEFEQEYYNQITAKGKIDFTDSLVWYKSAHAKFQTAQASSAAMAQVSSTLADANRGAFVYGFLKLLSCASDDMVSEFPSTFGFDLYRLAGFRAEVRKVVCIHLAISLYQQVMSAEIASLKSPEARQLSAQALSPQAINKLKQDIIAIISDSSGNAKWTKNTQSLSLEFAKRIEETVHKKNVTVPCQRLVSLCSGWLSKHLQPRSEVYKLLENKTMTNLFSGICSGLCAISGLDSTVISNGLAGNPIPEGPVSKETISLADRILVLVKFHWGVFGKYYSAYLALSEEKELSAATASALLLSGTSSNSNDDGLDDSVEMVTRTDANSDAVQTISSSRMRQPSTC
ncbi:Sok1p [Sugiyamaella lignohabitans]|uniref:Sok1p n=1 Tax=Sugiyamaella lignohabitans TaxID=796027 RepID=A0A167E4L2_9ASCO|nr:Sok1p [Sugiyamaella lignohabitans]ANB13630.1 Sok1p [Sugiyamaella lignohabitans]